MPFTESRMGLLRDLELEVLLVLVDVLGGFLHGLLTLFFGKCSIFNIVFAIDVVLQESICVLDIYDDFIIFINLMANVPRSNGVLKS